MGLALSVLCLCFHAVRGDELFDDEEPPKPIPDQVGRVYREVRSIPYASGGMYVEKGITGAFSGGKYQNLGEDQSLFQWQGELGYFYTPWFSAGLAFKINAGEPSFEQQKVFNRYYANGRFHKAFRKASLYAGLQIGVDDLNVLSGAPDRDSIGTQFQKSIDDIQAGLGIELGAGWKFSRWAGLTLGTVGEYSLVSDENSFYGNDLNLRVVPGIAIDVLAFTDTLRELVPALYVNMEFQGGFLLLQRGQKNNDRAYMLGMALAF